AILIIWEQPFIKRQAWAKVVPGALVAVVLAVVINQIYMVSAPDFAVGESHLVILPILGSAGVDFASLLTFPDFSAILNPLVWKAAVVIAIIASLETLLSVEAVDKLDPHKRRTPQNRELKAQGMGNIISGLVGGIPMTAVIV
ncbi:SulP family inorganic anion transporter, partial [Arthrospira platensis SPKY1]|nr:SulP family inorganic anion transporter [Arthrospira platensis SPKY1]